MHPPYWRQIVYNDDPRCLSTALTLDAFFGRLRLVLRNCQSVLTRRGKIAVLIGGYSERGVFQPLPHLTGFTDRRSSQGCTINASCSSRVVCDRRY
ncbi:hypothetical protein [Botrimarina mediterranea]|uniref:Uncharacterized protein n=1 Tax=Botrimarina mediterranea TaxID=2528022 RepID=A0A518K7Q4_9BACT|nr:hypothetical protein [Botrimarina mediterranea]QDV73816.1 hypothetical protein Spa11_20150 [Botrimarina mediterranea]